jgi:hypothetical protein
MPLWTVNTSVETSKYTFQSFFLNENVKLKQYYFKRSDGRYVNVHDIQKLLLIVQRRAYLEEHLTFQVIFQ